MNVTEFPQIVNYLRQIRYSERKLGVPEKEHKNNGIEQLKLSRRKNINERKRGGDKILIK